MQQEKSIINYFKDKNIFLTGGSGFVGKALIEKLLRSCPDIGKIYILLRPKKGKEIHERLEDILKGPLFNKLKKLKPDFHEKIIPINGDTGLPRLGISAEDTEFLIENTHIICNAAASVKFDDFLKDAVFANIRSARECALLALSMKKIEVFMHISTTYCNIDNREEVEEILYPQHGNWRDLIDVVENCDDIILSSLTQKYIDVFPNTYTYTKQLSEHCINDLLVGKIPTVICRPSVVVSSMYEPMTGWTDNFNGPVGLLLAGGSGILRIVYGNKESVQDYMIVDNLVKLIILAIWEKVNYGDGTVLSIYHASKYETCPFSLNDMVAMGKRLYFEVPFKNKFWFPGNSMTNCWYYYYFGVILFHLFPAIIVDSLLSIAGKKPFLFKLQRKVYVANIAVSHFMLNEWKFVNRNSVELITKIPPQELDQFFIKIEELSDEQIYDFYLKCCDYARRYLLKEYDDITEETRTKTLRMYYLDRFIKIFTSLWFIWVVFFKYNIISVFFNLSVNYWNNLPNLKL